MVLRRSAETAQSLEGRSQCQGIGQGLLPRWASPVSARRSGRRFHWRRRLWRPCLRASTPEYKVRFDNLSGEPRNADLVALGRAAGTSVALSLEAKADESFGEFVSKLLLKAACKIAQEIPTGAIQRVQGLASALLPPRQGGNPPLGELRYQLLTATAGALAFAKQASAQVAVLVIHEFRSDCLSARKLADNQRDLNQFVGRLSGGKWNKVGLGKLVGPIQVRGNSWIPSDVPLYVGKVYRDLIREPTNELLQQTGSA